MKQKHGKEILALGNGFDEMIYFAFFTKSVLYHKLCGISAHNSCILGPHPKLVLCGVTKIVKIMYR